MEKEFVPYELALRLKALGFDEPCIIEMSSGNFDIPIDEYRIRGVNQDDIIYKLNMIKPIRNSEIDGCTRPTFSQAFDWFLEKHSLYFRPDYCDELKEYDFQGNIHKLGKYSAIVFIGNHKTHKEAELASLIKLIEIVETK